MAWDCTRTEECLSDALAQALPPDEDAALQAHAGECERCRRLLARVGGIVFQLHDLPLVEEPPFLASRIIALTRETPAERSTKRWFAGPSRIWQPRFAMGLVTVAATVLIVFHAVSTGTPGKLELFSPAGLYHSVNRRAHLTYARGAKFVNDLRVVYEIQSRLSAQPEPVSEPTPPERRPDFDALPKPETDPTRNGTVPRFIELAVLMLDDHPQNVWELASRSLQ
jgi:predicted anti-sigma-YlaC factor YlaD